MISDGGCVFLSGVVVGGGGWRLLCDNLWFYKVKKF